MRTVFVLQHVHTLPDDVEDVKLIGVYSSRDEALKAVDRQRQHPGFRDFPLLVDPSVEGSGPDGFHIAEYQLDLDYWSEGFVTV